VNTINFYCNSNCKFREKLDEAEKSKRTNSILDNKQTIPIPNKGKPFSGIDKFDSTEELKNIKIKSQIIKSNQGENFKTIPNVNFSEKNTIDQANHRLMYQMLENRINELEKEFTLSIINK
jgi:hypothetical protein